MLKEKMEIRSLPIKMLVDDKSSFDELAVKGIIVKAGAVSELLTNPSNGRQFKETITQGVFNDAINDAIQSGERIDFLSMHDKSLILSSTDNNSLNINETDKGLEFSANISPTSWGKDTFQLISDGIIKGMSFGMRVLDEAWSLMADGTPLRIINKVKLFEVSAVRTPAYKSSEVEARGMDIINDVAIPTNILKKEEDKVVNDEEEKVVTEEEKPTEKVPEDAKPEEDATPENRDGEDDSSDGGDEVDSGDSGDSGDDGDSEDRDGEEVVDDGIEERDEEPVVDDASEEREDAPEEEEDTTDLEERFNTLEVQLRGLKTAFEALVLSVKNPSPKEDVPDEKRSIEADEEMELKSFFN